MVYHHNHSTFSHFMFKRFVFDFGPDWLNMWLKHTSLTCCMILNRFDVVVVGGVVAAFVVVVLSDLFIFARENYSRTFVRMFLTSRWKMISPRSWERKSKKLLLLLLLMQKRKNLLPSVENKSRQSQWLRRLAFDFKGSLYFIN